MTAEYVKISQNNEEAQEFIIDDPALHAISVKPLFALFAGDVGEVWVVGFEAEAI